MARTGREKATGLMGSRARRTELPAVVRRALEGHWPAVLYGPEIVDIVILIECGMSARDFPMWREDEVENATWEQYLDPRWTARLENLAIADVVEPEFGCADRQHAIHYSTLTTKAPPIVVEGRRLMDGNHRLEAARIRNETRIDAYVLERTDVSGIASYVL